MLHTLLANRRGWSPLMPEPQGCVTYAESRLYKGSRYLPGSHGLVTEEEEEEEEEGSASLD